jgi:hypothetical protein
MRTKYIILLVSLLISASPPTQGASVGTAFTYQGRLTDGGTPANGTYDLRFRLFNAPSAIERLNHKLEEQLKTKDARITELETRPAALERLFAVRVNP